jgi:hypothetical protein
MLPIYIKLHRSLCNGDVMAAPKLLLRGVRVDPAGGGARAQPMPYQRMGRWRSNCAAR